MDKIYNTPESDCSTHSNNVSFIEKYFKFWCRGWWAFLFMLIFNFASGIGMAPIAFFTQGNELLYWVIASFIGILIVIPFGGWLFEKFCYHSKRISG